MLWTPQSPAPTPTRSPLRSPFPLPISLHPSCVLALLPQNDPKWFDHSGRGNHGVVHGATPTAKGPDGFAWEFDGVDDVIDLGTADLVNGLTSFTLAARVNIFSFKVGHHRLFSHETVLYAGKHGSEMSIIVGDGINWTQGSINMGTMLGLDRQWIQLIYVKDGTIVRAYIQGTDTRQTMTVIAVLGNNGMKRAIGALAPENFTQLWDGLIDYVLIYNQAWSPRPADANYLPEIDPFLGGF